MISIIYRHLYSKIKELNWIKHVALNTRQYENPEINTPYNTPAVFISFENQDIVNLGQNHNQVTTNIIFKFIMRDFNKDQLLCLDYSSILGKKINGFLGAQKVGENYYIDQDMNYVLDLVFRYIYVEDMNAECEFTEGVIEQINIELDEVQTLTQEEGQGFASDGVDISPSV